MRQEEKDGAGSSVGASSAEPRGLLNTRLLCVVASLLAVTSSFAATSRLHPPSKKQAGALRVTVVGMLGTRAEILELGVHYDLLIASGIADSDLRDGSLGAGKTFCCGKTDEGLATWFYIPPGVEVEPGDVVEVRMGRKPKGKHRGDPGELNTVTRVRFRNGEYDGICWWDPPDDSLWRRIFYCKGMEEEGWTLAKGAWKAWIKPAPTGPGE